MRIKNLSKATFILPNGETVFPGAKFNISKTEFSHWEKEAKKDVLIFHRPTEKEISNKPIVYDKWRKAILFNEKIIRCRSIFKMITIGDLVIEDGG